MSKEKLAPTVELSARVGEKDLHYYMVAGCCGARSTATFNHVSPRDFITGMVDSGISGNVMIAIDAKTDGADANAFKEYVEANELGTVTVAPGVENQYTGRTLVTVVFEYNPYVLVKHIHGEDWTKPEGWYSKTDNVWMDYVFYRNGGRPKPADRVDWAEYKRATGVGADDEEIGTQAA